MNRLVMILLMGLLCISNVSYAGNGDLTVGGTLEMTSSENGFLPPRMTTSARGNLSPSPGMLIYNTDDNAYNYYASSGWKALAASLPVHDNTGASADYALAVGETAKVIYTSATSVPLYIATVEGEYEISIKTSSVQTNPTNGDVILKPNNATYANISRNHIYHIFGQTTAIAETHTQNGFYIAYGNLVRFTARISTATTNKYVCGTGVKKHNDNSRYQYIFDGIWDDTSIVWASLGTVTFPAAQSGTIIIRRIL